LAPASRQAIVVLRKPIKPIRLRAILMTSSRRDSNEPPREAVYRKLN
jgi:hypothetical protein